MTTLSKKELANSAITFAIILSITTLVWFIKSEPHTSTNWNDHLFCGSSIAFCIGSIIAVVSKSRRHYYLHLKDKFAGKKEDDTDFEQDEIKRDRQARFGITIAAGGILGISVCILALLFVK